MSACTHLVQGGHQKLVGRKYSGAAAATAAATTAAVTAAATAAATAAGRPNFVVIVAPLSIALSLRRRVLDLAERFRRRTHVAGDGQAIQTLRKATVIGHGIRTSYHA